MRKNGRDRKYEVTISLKDFIKKCKLTEEEIKEMTPKKLGELLKQYAESKALSLISQNARQIDACKWINESRELKLLRKKLSFLRINHKKKVVE